MNFNVDKIEADDIRKIILNTKEPLLVKNLMKCELISWSLEDWEEVLKDEILQFRCGKYQYTSDPQWETTCSNISATFKDFLDMVDLQSKEWWYFDYKYLREWFTDKEVLKAKINWSALGFSEVTTDESTIWIGSKGAHTSCHMDTYGCNMILQVYGRKQWILFPPEQNLKPTRIPFEESSIYSKLNFFSPREEDFRGISKCHKVILNPGDVLILPHRWWHYVENLDTAVSVNVWLPLPQDDLERIKESIATIFVSQMTTDESSFRNIILNPNMLKEMVTCDQALDIISTTLEKFKPPNKIPKLCGLSLKLPEYNVDIKEALNKYKCISKVPIIDQEEFRLFLRSQLQRFSFVEDFKEQENRNLACKKIIDFLGIVTNDEVLSLIAKKFLEKRQL